MERIALIKMRHEALLAKGLLVEEDMDVVEEAAVSAPKIGDEDFEECEELLSSILEVDDLSEKEIAHFGNLPKKKGRILDDEAWYEDHRSMRSRGRVLPTKEARDNFIRTLTDNTELAKLWFPELALLDEDVAKTFLSGCLSEKDWDEQHADREVHLYKVGNIE